MVLTEEEAKTIRCQESFGPLYVTRDGGDIHRPMHHFISVALLPGAGAMPSGGRADGLGHNMPTVASPSHCIGSKCMAWRWTLDEEAAWSGAPRGYCGKAGKP